MIMVIFLKLNVGNQMINGYQPLSIRPCEKDWNDDVNVVDVLGNLES